MKVRQMNTYKVCRYSELGLATTSMSFWQHTFLLVHLIPCHSSFIRAADKSSGFHLKPTKETV